MAKKKYYNGGGKGDAFQAYPPDNNMGGLDMDQSMFGFPSRSRIMEYPAKMQFDNMGGADKDSIVGTDYEIDKNVVGLNRNKSNQRF